MHEKIGFMQGRLVHKIDGRIQAFPLVHWREEFPAAEKLGLRWMEWTLDSQGLTENPLCTELGRSEIRRLCLNHNLEIKTLTCDCFMQEPFWKTKGDEIQERLKKLMLVLKSAAALHLRYVVIPLVDNGSLETVEQEDTLVRCFTEYAGFLRLHGVGIAFESDFPPESLARFINRLPIDTFGINYDTGNSASLGYNSAEEFRAYGNRIFNVHIKDRLLHGTTVPLGTGNADFKSVFQNLSQLNYQGLLILQTARANNDDHSGVLKQYADFTNNLINLYYGS